MNRHILRLLLICTSFSCFAALAAAQSYPAGPGAAVPPPPAPMGPDGQTAWPPPASPAAPPEQAVWPQPAPSQSPPPGQYLVQPTGPIEPPAPLVDGGLTVFATGNMVPRWAVSIDALWLERSVSRGVCLGYTDYWNPGPNPPARDSLWSDDVLLPLEPGIRVQLLGQISERSDIEAVGWGLQQWSVGRAIYGDPDHFAVLAYSPWLQLSDPHSGINGFDDRLAYTYKSQVANVELNQRFRFNTYDPFHTAAWLWGVRYFYLSDDLSLSGSDLSTGNYENLDWKTNNNLIGLQVGLNWARGWDRFQLSSEAKIGLYANIYSQKAADSVSGPSGALPYNLSHGGTDLAFLGEISLLARYRVSSCLWLRAGYQFYYAAGLATAPRQLGGFDNSGDVGLDGLSLGVEYTR